MAHSPDHEDVDVTRQAALHDFVSAQLATTQFALAPASADASFRSYWRISVEGQTRVVMDAPPDKEPLVPWLDIGTRLHAAGLHVPQVLAVDVERGFVLMEDLGTRPYLPALNDASVDALYADAFDALLAMQTRVSTDGLAPFDAGFAAMELGIMPAWFLQRHLGYTPSDVDVAILDAAQRVLIDNLAAQPQRFMHRDFHSRNLMITASSAPTALSNPGIIDFQGALLGPITYDLASLLRDCYIAWPSTRVAAWAEAYRQRLLHAGVVSADAAEFARWFDLTGLQRHVKVLGLFCRLHYRDGKAAYLADLPLVLTYVLDVSRRYVELHDFAALIERAVADRDVRIPCAPDAAASSICAP